VVVADLPPLMLEAVLLALRHEPLRQIVVEFLSPKVGVNNFSRTNIKSGEVRKTSPADPKPSYSFTPSTALAVL